MTDDEITKYIFVSDTELKGDIAIVFGTYNARKAAVDRAIQLYNNGQVPKILFSGGINKHSGVIEAEEMANEAVKQGIPSKDIIIENRSANTLENVILSLATIDKEMGLNKVRKIIAIMKNYHARRALMTLKKHFPSNIEIRAAAYISPEYNFDENNWLQSKLGKEKVFGEVDKIKQYLAKGDLMELN